MSVAKKDKKKEKWAEDVEPEVLEDEVPEQKVDEEPAPLAEGDPGYYFGLYKEQTAADGPCIIRCNNKMWLEIIDAGYQPINDGRVFLRDEAYADGEFIVEELPGTALGEGVEEPPPPVVPVAEQRTFVGADLDTLTIDVVSAPPELVEIEGAVYPLPPYTVTPTNDGLITTDLSLWALGVNVLVTAVFADQDGLD